MGRFKSLRPCKSYTVMEGLGAEPMARSDEALLVSSLRLRTLGRQHVPGMHRAAIAFVWPEGGFCHETFQFDVARGAGGRCCDQPQFMQVQQCGWRHREQWRQGAEVEAGVVGTQGDDARGNVALGAPGLGYLLQDRA